MQSIMLIMDNLTPERRSSMMSRIRSKDTKPEFTVRRLVWGMGYRYRLHYRGLPGCPDIVLPRHRKVVFIHGCFWHSHPGCKRATVPKTRLEFWIPKLTGNVERHRRNGIVLRKLGWKILVIWECELRELSRVVVKITQFMKEPSFASQMVSDDS